MNLSENPFWILKASPTDSRQRLMELEREGELLGNGKEARDACQALSMRYSRLSA